MSQIQIRFNHNCHRVQTLSEQQRQDRKEATFTDTRPTLNPIHILFYLPRSIQQVSVAITSDLVS